MISSSCHIVTGPGAVPASWVPRGDHLRQAGLVAGLFIAIGPAGAAPVANWTERTGDTPVSALNTASPSLGDGSTDSADQMSIYATFPTFTLANTGNTVTLSGSATLSGIVGAANQFRWGLYDVNGSSGDTGWLGYIGSCGHSTNSSNLLERSKPNTSWYMSSTGGATATIATAIAPGTGFTDGTYNFLLTLERIAAGIRINSSLIRASDSQQFGLHSFTDTTPQTYTFNRVGFLIGNTLDADQVQFSNIDVTAVPFVPDTTPPLLVAKSPPDDATRVPLSPNLVATFDEDVAAGSGTITLKKTSGNVTVGSFNVANSSEVIFDGTNVSFVLSGALDPIVAHHFLIDDGAIVDGSGNPYGGISSATVWNFTTLDPATVVNPGTRVFGVEFNRNDAFGSPSQSMFRIVSGSTTQGSNAISYTKNIGPHQVTISQPAATNFEFRGANGDSSRAIPGGDTSLSFLVSDFIATREGAIDIGVTGLAAGDYVFRSYHLDTFNGSGLGFAQGSTTNTSNNIEARIGGLAKASVQPSALGPSALNTTFINNGQIPTLEFNFSHDGASPLTIELRSTVSNGTASFLLLNGFEIYESAP
jgi:hypothetical protein